MGRRQWCRTPWKYQKQIENVLTKECEIRSTAEQFCHSDSREYFVSKEIVLAPKILMHLRRRRGHQKNVIIFLCIHTIGPYQIISTPPNLIFSADFSEKGSFALSDFQRSRAHAQVCLWTPGDLGKVKKSKHTVTRTSDKKLCLLLKKGKVQKRNELKKNVENHIPHRIALMTADLSG